MDRRGLDPLRLDPGTHEFEAFLQFDCGREGIEAFVPLPERIDAATEPLTATTAVHGETYDLELTYSEGNLKPPAEFDLDFVPEFSLSVSDRDGRGLKGGSFEISFSWPGRESRGDYPDPSSPPGFEGVNVRTNNMRNLPPEDYPELFRRTVAAFGVSEEYFEDPSPSQILRIERYVRVRQDRIGRLIGSSSPMRRIFDHVTDSGNVTLEARNGETEGKYNVLTFDNHGAGKLIDGHSLGKQVKVYLLKDSESVPEDHPSYHPKVCVKFDYKETDRGTIPWEDLDDLLRELDEFLLNLLADAGLPVRADKGVYVSDDYWSVTESPRDDIDLVDGMTDDLQRIQDGAANALWADGIESDREILRAMTDGGDERGLSTVGEAVSVSSRTVRRRVKQQFDGILRIVNGVVTWESEYLKDAVNDRLDAAKDALEADDRLKEAGSALIRLIQEYGFEVEDLDGRRPVLRNGRLLSGKDFAELRRELKSAWIRSGRDLNRFDKIRIEWVGPDGKSHVRTPW